MINLSQPTFTIASHLLTTIAFGHSQSLTTWITSNLKSIGLQNRRKIEKSKSNLNPLLPIRPFTDHKASPNECEMNNEVNVNTSSVEFTNKISSKNIKQKSKKSKESKTGESSSYYFTTKTESKGKKSITENSSILYRSSYFDTSKTSTHGPRNQISSCDKENSSFFFNTDQKNFENSKLVKSKKKEPSNQQTITNGVDKSIKATFESFCESESDILSFRELRERVLRCKDSERDE